MKLLSELKTKFYTDCCFLLAPHKWTFVRNIYGDEINWLGKRSEWVCTACDKTQYRDSLNERALL